MTSKTVHKTDNNDNDSQNKDDNDNEDDKDCNDNDNVEDKTNNRKIDWTLIYICIGWYIYLIHLIIAIILNIIIII